jgi:hypothetical protein
MGKATIFFMISYLFGLTASLYSCLAGILTNGRSLVESAGSGVFFAIGGISLWVVCFRAHEVTRTVRHHNLSVCTSIYVDNCTEAVEGGVMGCMVKELEDFTFLYAVVFPSSPFWTKTTSLKRLSLAKFFI